MPEERLSASLEDYLEAIFHVVEAKQASRAKDIADRLNVNSSSVTSALHALKERGLVNYEPYDLVTLTPEGLRRAKQVVRGHEALRSFFVDVLGVENSEAEAAACGMEHAMSPLVLDRLVRFVEFVGTAPGARFQWDEDEGDFRNGTSDGRD
ncbi:MAG TPA: metal-dependent transcriptional regulator [Candidatus Hydrogenedentes bacterium]|jgi:DtxR family Mn-dependent transcriptional regulator|nr:metal-dependent transcriptional regulator [Candidatus Hydrogenedentota bacterium]MDY0032100.1 metal-dependent transcriptional regulator [FCB group bacterium]NLT61530.1 metal-dependent transcriptional regulator [Candidatus Hydrogenedentota bacterium]HNV21409.1 metal-dependent transcriptional regulator [Candidatus Hydrogenedentota bacterium]HNZ18977.1 metal-dependent transcriptional regulator [Candidatus Hydrogenedentota bacterium]